MNSMGGFEMRPHLGMWCLLLGPIEVLVAERAVLLSYLA